jgi:hypothetical protein
LIDAEFAKEDTVRSPATGIGRTLKLLDNKTDYFLNLKLKSSKIVNMCPIGKEADRCQLQK